MSGFKLDPDAWYTVPQLVALMGLTQKHPGRALVRSGVAFRKVGVVKYFQGAAVLKHFGVVDPRVLQFRQRAG